MEYSFDIRRAVSFIAGHLFKCDGIYSSSVFSSDTLSYFILRVVGASSSLILNFRL